MKFRIILITFCILLLLIAASIIESFNHNRTDVPEIADVIIVLTGDEGRMKEAANLYVEGYAEYVLLTPVNESLYPMSTQFALDLGIPSEALIKEYDATSTYTNATHSLKIMRELDLDSGLVVTSDYHLKRTKMIYDRINDYSYDLKYIAALGPNDETWDERNEADIIWFSEFYKLWGYRLGLYKYID